MDEYGKEKVAQIWIKVIHSLKDLLSDHIPKHRHSDQFLGVRDAVIALAVQQETADAIGDAYVNTIYDSNRVLMPEAEIVVIVIKELEAIPNAVNVYKMQKSERSLKEGALPI